MESAFVGTGGCAGAGPLTKVVLGGIEPKLDLAHGTAQRLVILTLPSEDMTLLVGHLHHLCPAKRAQAYLVWEVGASRAAGSRGVFGGLNMHQEDNVMLPQRGPLGSYLRAAGAERDDSLSPHF